MLASLVDERPSLFNISDLSMDWILNGVVCVVVRKADADWIDKSSEADAILCDIFIIELGAGCVELCSLC